MVTGPAGIARRVAFALRQFNLGSRAVLDVGCGPGHHLAHFGPGSVGLELSGNSIEQARGRGLDVRAWNFVDPIPGDLEGGFDAVWCSALFEHVLRPHEFLLAMRAALRPGGRFLAIVPITRLVHAGPWGGFLAADHVNFFTRRTLRYTLTRAGLRIMHVGSPSLPRAPLWLSSAAGVVSPNLLVVAELIENFDYPTKAHKRLRGSVPIFEE